MHRYPSVIGGVDIDSPGSIDVIDPSTGTAFARVPAGGGVEVPFGGVKKPGHGREKGFAALLGYTKVKSVVVRH